MVLVVNFIIFYIFQWSTIKKQRNPKRG